MEPAPRTLTRIAGAPPWATLTELLADAATRHGDKEFLRCADRTLGFREADVRTDRLARALTARGVRPGDRVAIMLDNGADWPLSWFAALKAGAVTVPVNTRYGEADLAHVLRDSGATLVVASDGCAPLVRGLGHPRTVLTPPELQGAHPGGPVPRAAPDDIVSLQYTSGTTGFPKACVLDHDYWLRTAWHMATGAGLRPDDVMLTAQAFSYVDPQWKAVMCLMTGIPLVVLPKFSASGFWPAVRRHRATVTYVLGGMPMLLHKQPPHPEDRNHRMRLVLCSGIPRPLHRTFEERWGAPWREVYGSTESGLDLIMPPGERTCVGTGALGHPPPGKEVVVADAHGAPVPPGQVGQILVRGRPLMKGYWRSPHGSDQVLRDGWYHTGDLGRRDAAGHVHHVGRLRDVIRRGGENIAPAEVESVLEAHPAVLSAAVIGIPDELFGELPKAFVRLRPGHHPTEATARSLLAHTRRQLARFKVPACLEFTESFPLTPSARVQKRRLLRPGPDQRSGTFDTAADTWA
ncbi:class I adenylate-forming enzyme family protein [Streptomyces sp. NPDC057877]|uniref:class I adenylate-forming enzyme family protein n=1 Tax=Streptomyces sp. NPDC057877 TaxID=3346269 RepID=UPI0036B3484B